MNITEDGRIEAGRPQVVPLKDRAGTSEEGHSEDFQLYTLRQEEPTQENYDSMKYLFVFLLLCGHACIFWRDSRRVCSECCLCRRGKEGFSLEQCEICDHRAKVAEGED